MYAASTRIGAGHDLYDRADIHGGFGSDNGVAGCVDRTDVGRGASGTVRARRPHHGGGARGADSPVATLVGWL